MTEIKTLVYFDIEATGLKSSGRPRISEISFVALDTQEFFDLNQKLLEKLKNVTSYEDILELETFLPRVLNKLTLCVYPMATIMPEVSKITGLDNYNLTGQARFDKSTGDMLKTFLSRLPLPVCLVAHNGNMYDFPLLQAELVKTGAELGLNILCVDSYVGIKEIYKMNMGSSLAVEANPVDKEICEDRNNVKKELEAVKILLETGEFDKEMDADEKKSNEVTKNPENYPPRNLNNNKMCGDRNTVEKELQAVKILLETGEFDKKMDTDEKKSNEASKNQENEQSRNINDIKMFIGKNENEQTPLKNSALHFRNSEIIKRKQMMSTEFFKCRKKSKFSVSDSPQSFSLISLHEHLLGYKPTISHGAEADCLALLRITAVLGEKWLLCVKNNCSLFSEVKAMWKS
jgi:DNA polymerase III epsilon subunit-like protein